MRPKLIFVLVLLTMCSVAEAQRARARRIRPSPSHATAQTCTGNVYYVRTDGNNTNSGTTNTAGGAWRTIDKGYDTAVAGDCVRVQAGTYNETVTPGHSGSVGNTITVVADGTVTTCGMNWSTARSYVRTIGLTLDPSSGTCGGSPSSAVVSGSGTSTGLEFWNVTIASNANGRGFAFLDFSSTTRCNSCIFLGGSISNIGGGTVSDTALYITGNDVFAGYISFSTICYVGVSPAGNRQRFLNLNFSGMVQCNGSHPDFYYSNLSADNLGLFNMLIESNFGVGTTSASDNKFQHMQNQPDTGAWADNVERLNVSYNLGAQFLSHYPSSNSESRWRIYHNTIVSCMRAAANIAQSYCGTVSGASFGLSMWIYNNLYQQAWGDNATSGIEPYSPTASPTITGDYNLAFDPDGSVSFTANWTGQAHEQSNIDPKLTDIANNDFTLQSASGARGVGGPLTTATSCSGSTLNVAANTGSFFVGDNSANLAAYGGKLVPGDTITMNATQYVVSSVSGDALTVVPNPSCSNGDAVYYGTSSTIDIGAYPFKAGGYTLSATKSCATGVCTITPNDASLVRFVVCYEAGVPYSVINASPYTCANPTGTFEARVYPRYASQTLYVVAN